MNLDRLSTSARTIVSLAVIILAISLVSAADSFSLGTYQETTSGHNRQGVGEGHAKASNGFVITGLGLGSYDYNDYNNDEVGPHILRPIVIYTRELLSNGSLGTEKVVSLGNKNKAERIIKLPEGFIMTGWGAGVKARSNGNWKVDYLEINGIRINNNSIDRITLINKTTDGTLDNYAKLPEGYAGTLIRGVVYKGLMEKTNIGGKQILVNGKPLNITNITIDTNQTNQTNQTTNQTFNDTIILTVFNPNIVATEGDLVRINYAAISTAGNLSFFISHPFNQSFTRAADNHGWQTRVGDKGSYIVNFTARNDRHSATIKVNVTILPFINNSNNQTNQTNQTNRVPIIDSVRYTGDEEGDTFRIIVSAHDDDNDQLTITCSQPFGNDCDWETEDGDEGDYDVTVTVSDGKSQTTRVIEVEVDDEDDENDDDDSSIRRVGEFQNNDLAYNNRLYYDEDASTTGMVSLTGQSSASSTKAARTLNWLMLFLILILIVILAIIIVLITRK